jgi:hypothetical protein
MNGEHFIEEVDCRISRIYKNINLNKFKTQFKKELLKITEEDEIIDDISIIPRVIPNEYFKDIRKTCKILTEFYLRLASDKPDKIIELLFGNSNNIPNNHKYLILHKPQRLVGSIRYDFAIDGKLESGNYPKLIEANSVAPGGMGINYFTLEVLRKLLPDLNKYYHLINLPQNQLNNIRRLGNNICIVCFDSITWSEKSIINNSDNNTIINLVTFCNDSDKIDIRFNKIKRCKFKISNNNLYLNYDRQNHKQDVLNFSYVLEADDWERMGKIIKKMVKSRVMQFSPLFMESIVCNKRSMVLMNDENVINQYLDRKKYQIIKKSVIRSSNLLDLKNAVIRNPEKYVLKHILSCGGKEGLYQAINSWTTTSYQ